jgi:hypothetical protein
MLRSDVKPALMSAIEAEFAKNPQAGGFTPTRVSRADLRKAAAAAATSTSSSSSAGPALRGKGGKAAAAAPAAADAFDPDDMLPRTDISDEISSSFIAKLSSANWKERKEAMEAVEGILQGAGYRIQPQVWAGGAPAGPCHWVGRSHLTSTCCGCGPRLSMCSSSFFMVCTLWVEMHRVVRGSDRK